MKKNVTDQFSTYDRDNEDIVLTTPISYIKDIEPSANVTDGRKKLESREDNIPCFLVI